MLELSFKGGISTKKRRCCWEESERERYIKRVLWSKLGKNKKGKKRLAIKFKKKFLRVTSPELEPCASAIEYGDIIH